MAQLFCYFLTYCSHFNYVFICCLPLRFWFPKEMIISNLSLCPCSIHCSGDAQYSEWMNECMNVHIPLLYYSKVLYCLSLLYGATEWVSVLQTELCQDALCYASVVISTVNTQSNVIMLHWLLVTSVNILPTLEASS